MSPNEVDPITFILFLPFYILSSLLSTMPPLPQLPVATATPSKTTFSNIEEWTIREMPNGTVKMTIHRKAQRE